MNVLKTIEDLMELTAMERYGTLNEIEEKRLIKLTYEYISYIFNKTAENEKQLKINEERLNRFEQVWEETELINNLYAGFLDSKGLTDEFLTYMDEAVGNAAATVARKQFHIVN